ncbi:uncharacterized protein B0H18DRAFT_1116770 [Fomitopsis serialis]|uniref:uncharacterized protein n=1 Tax=Fomitopsis serialis TaxID=139415 RepID=UPI0020072B34|nr:uncharacterized protein B0H18DRAFT_1116770 [Neoantrodia serialis]KAH9930650.1 hypothetical protein B0H18DRAFT_1116770 [Neoantrodia serialis]
MNVFNQSSIQVPTVNDLGLVMDVGSNAAATGPLAKTDDPLPPCIAVSPSLYAADDESLEQEARDNSATRLRAHSNMEEDHFGGDRADHTDCVTPHIYSTKPLSPTGDCEAIVEGSWDVMTKDTSGATAWKMRTTTRNFPLGGILNSHLLASPHFERPHASITGAFSIEPFRPELTRTVGRPSKAYINLMDVGNYEDMPTEPPPSTVMQQQAATHLPFETTALLQVDLGDAEVSSSQSVAVRREAHTMYECYPTTSLPSQYWPFTIMAATAPSEIHAHVRPDEAYSPTHSSTRATSLPSSDGSEPDTGPQKPTPANLHQVHGFEECMVIATETASSTGEEGEKSFSERNWAATDLLNVPLCSHPCDDGPPPSLFPPESVDAVLSVFHSSSLDSNAGRKTNAGKKGRRRERKPWSRRSNMTETNCAQWKPNGVPVILQRSIRLEDGGN